MGWKFVQEIKGFESADGSPDENSRCWEWGWKSVWRSRVWGRELKGFTSVSMSLHELWKVQEVALQSYEFFSLSKLLYITFLQILSIQSCPLGQCSNESSTMKMEDGGYCLKDARNPLFPITPPWGRGCCSIPTRDLCNHFTRI
jgi:hypothetical protein